MGDVIDVEGEDVNTPPRPLRPNAESTPPPPQIQLPPLPRPPRTGTTAEHAARARAGGDVAPWMQQQQQ